MMNVGIEKALVMAITSTLMRQIEDLTRLLYHKRT